MKKCICSLHQNPLNYFIYCSELLGSFCLKKGGDFKGREEKISSLFYQIGKILIFSEHFSLNTPSIAKRVPVELLAHPAHAPMYLI